MNNIRRLTRLLVLKALIQFLGPQIQTLKLCGEWFYIIFQSLNDALFHTCLTVFCSQLSLTLPYPKTWNCSRFSILHNSVGITVALRPALTIDKNLVMECICIPSIGLKSQWFSFHCCGCNGNTTFLPSAHFPTCCVQSSWVVGVAVVIYFLCMPWLGFHNLAIVLIPLFKLPNSLVCKLLYKAMMKYCVLPEMLNGLF
jgi:hypothetical protein